ncbi:MAG: FecR domain-containing protein [Polyangiaceae bacterium]|nr:FecR domain-containing protein [Polyangiaceae bacterium]
MTTTSDRSTDSRALVALTELGRDGVERPTRAELDQGLNALYARIAAGRVRQRGFVRWSLVGVALALSTLLALQVASISRKRWSAPEPPTLAYQIEGGSILEGGYLRESGHEGIKLLFNEGSRFTLMPGARGRLRAVDKEGARVAIERGTASFEVRHGRDRRWLVEAGPFLVTVKGTVFTVSWDPLSERFELRLRRGRVVVSGPVSGGDVALRTGQRLVVSLARAETVITEDHPEDALVGASGAPAAPTPLASQSSQSSSAADKPARASPSAAPAPSTVAKVGGERRWADELASGHWDRILESVERAGVQATLDSASSEDLFALANAARYRRRADLARAALLAQRRRFPGSPRALDAVFLLGRVEESRSSGRARAITWYDDYLARAPAGAYAAEALGRKMTLTSELGGPAQAQPIAEEYLRRFPKGSYAGSARALLRVP